MRVLKKVVHERNRRLLFKNQELDYYLLKYLLFKMARNSGTNKSIFRRKAFFYFYGLNKKGSRSSLRNRCLISGRSRNTNKDFGLSRIKVREFFKYGELFSLRKVTW